MTPTQAVSDYVDKVRREYRSGIAAEHSYRPALEALLESVDSRINAVNDPKRLIPDSAPDFILLRDNRIPIAYVEAKDIGIDLNKTENDEQLGRYRRDFPNLLLTDYLEFRWYLGGAHQRTVRLGTTDGKKIHTPDSGLNDVQELLADFIQAAVPDVKSSRQLAEIMASMTRRIAELIEKALPESTTLKNEKEAFQQTLIPNLTNREFSDMYAQTLAYGLFAARVNYRGAKGTFSRRGVAEDIPRTNPFLRKLFGVILNELDARVDWMVDTLIQLLAHTDTDEILKDFGKGTRQNDPVLHFYETFLAEYDPTLREKRGVYYTPEPVVSYIVRSVDYLLRERFGRVDGLADENTLILDPATGTGTFLYTVVQHIHELFAGQEGAWDGYVRDHLLPRLFGFELLMASYAVAHMKLGILLRETGYTFSQDSRLGVYLTNTLEEGVKQTPLPLVGFISEEANAAVRVKNEEPIMVVLGNPPYSGHSANKGDWISKLIRDYYQVDGQPLGERQPKWLQDDYVKFIRFGQWRIDQTGSGTLAFVTNHGYLDNPTFRGMRQQLMASFDDIYILNLHGNSKKKEKTPDGGKDENVFDIQQGVAIGIFVKDALPHPPDTVPHAERGKAGAADVPLAMNGEGLGVRYARVHYADLWGVRAEKYAALLANDLDSTTWETFEPQPPFYLFTPQDLDLMGEYEEGWKITEVMPINSVGFVSARDSFAIDFDRESLRKRIAHFRDLNVKDEAIKGKYRLKDSTSWQMATSRRELAKLEQWENFLTTCLYRPFDRRSVYYSRMLLDRPVYHVQRHMLGNNNIGLITGRGIEANRAYDQIFCSDKIIQHHSLSIKEVNTLLPLYLYPDPNQLALEGDWPLGVGGRVPNLSKAFVAALEAKLGMTFNPHPLAPSPLHGEGERFTPEDVFHYAYAVFHSPTYRERYAEFLKIDFPRLPLTSDPQLFRDLGAKGAALVKLHLLEGLGIRDLMTTFNEGSGVVDKGYPKYVSPSPQVERGSGGEVYGRVYINKTQYFAGVPESAWEFHIGGYQVLEKWLKDRRGRTLSGDEALHYQKIVVALTRTQAIMDEIDDLIGEWPLA